MQSKGQFHVHTTDCADCAKIRKMPHVSEYKETHDSKESVAQSIYSDQIAEGCTIGEALSDIYFAPCVRFTAPKGQNQTAETKQIANMKTKTISTTTSTKTSRRFRAPGDEVSFDAALPTGGGTAAAIAKAEKTKKAPKAKKVAKPAKPAKVEKAAKVAKPAKVAKKTAKTTRIDTGYVAAIRKCLESGKYTISEMAKKIGEQFPDKEEKSIKRIGHNLAKKARKADAKTTSKWLPGAPASTGYMARIDELLRAGKLTTRQIGEKVAVEFPKDGVTPEDRLVSAKKVIRARLKRLRDGGEKFAVPSEASIRPAKEAKAPKAAKPAKAKKDAGSKAEAAVRGSMKKKAKKK